MKECVKVSIIIPVYNVKKYLEQCLNSVLEQSLTEIEVICVDDGSTDGSYDIMQAFALKDDRVKIYRFEKSKSALQARKLGVKNACGEYIMFLDADDYLELDACEKVYEKIKKETVDILHFSSRVVNCANLPDKRIEMNEKLLLPYEQRLEGEDVFNACFLNKDYGITLWNKIFESELCKQAFEDMEDKYLPKAQDLYSFFIIAYYAKSYLGWITEPLHNYCIGRGVVGSGNMNLDKFERYCTQANIVGVLREFSEKKQIAEKTEIIIDGYYNQWINECVRLWFKELSKNDSVKGLEIMYDYWGIKDTISCLGNNYWLNRVGVAEKIEYLPLIDLKKKEVKTIAIYYYHYTIGGVQRVMSLLAPMLLKMGYKVVIITDKEVEGSEFQVPEGVYRACVYNREDVTRENYDMRIESWSDIVKKYEIDMVFYNAWTSSLLLWDLLYLKKNDIPVIVHAHSVFSYSVNKLYGEFYDLTRILKLAEGMVVLSEADKTFWDAFNRNVHNIPNPISPELRQVRKANWENKALVWIGRVANEKQPEAVFEIMEKVAAKVSAAKLYLVGDFSAPKWQELAKKKGIEENIVFCGETTDVNTYYEKSSICLSTSKFEGFPMVLIEAQAHALPTVMFKMPHLTLGKKECGVIGVDMLDYTSAANEIECLFNDKIRWEEMSRLAEASYNWLCNYDFERAWAELIRGEQKESLISVPVKDMIHTFVNHYGEGIKFKGKQQKKPKKKTNTNPQPTGVKRYIKKMKSLIKLCINQGVWQACKYACKKIFC